MSAAEHLTQRRAQQAEIEASLEEEALDWDDLYDSEKVLVRSTFTALSESTGHRELSGFQREVRERFAEIGIVARCDFYEDPSESHLEGVQRPTITLVGRCEPTKVGEFDHDQMGHEVRSNLLGKKDQDNVQPTQIAPGWSQSASGLIAPD